MAEKKKKEKTEIKLPKAWQSVKHRNEMAQGRETYNSLWTAIGVVFVIGAIAFVLLGGINQRKAIEWVFEFSRKIGDTISSWFNPDDVVVNDDGIYIQPGSGGGSATEGTTVVVTIDDGKTSETTTDSGKE
jgi:hypothetical protein